MADDSILTGTKKALGIDETQTAFDPEITMHINSVFSTLTQLGIGPEAGFMIQDASTMWGTFLGTDLVLNNVKTYMYLRVKLLFDPPATSFALDAMSKQVSELEWRINVHRESTAWVDPDPDPDPTLDTGGEEWLPE